MFRITGPAALMNWQAEKEAEKEREREEGKVSTEDREKKKESDSLLWWRTIERTVCCGGDA